METRQLDCEIRSAGDAKPATIAGTVVRFNVLSSELRMTKPDGKVLRFRERIRPGAFTKVLTSGRDIRALLGHDQNMLLGRQSTGTLRLAEDNEGLRFEADVPDTSYGRDLLVLAKRGDIRAMSFGFSIPTNGERWLKEDGVAIRELLEVDLWEVSPVGQPAYPLTDMALRVAPDAWSAAEAMERSASVNLSALDMKLRRALLGV